MKRAIGSPEAKPRKEGKGGKAQMDSFLEGVADSPGKGEVEEEMDEGDVWSEGVDNWWEREALMDEVEIRMRGMLEEVLGSKFAELRAELVMLRKELDVAKEEVKKLKDTQLIGGGGKGWRATWGDWPKVFGEGGLGKGGGA